MEQTPEQIHKSTLDSVNLIDSLMTKIGELTEEELDVVDRNIRHIQIMLKGTMLNGTDLTYFIPYL
jgi:hypothetical protein